MSPHDANIAVAGSKLDMNISVELGAVLGTLLGTSLGPRVDDAFLSGLGSSKQIGTVYIYTYIYPYISIVRHAGNQETKGERRWIRNDHERNGTERSGSTFD